MEATFLIYGDSAVSVKMGDEISIKVNHKVRWLMKAIKDQPIDGVREMVPTYASLMVHYDPVIIRYAKLVEEIQKRIEAIKDTKTNEVHTIMEIPICYGGDLGPDLRECAKLDHVSPQEIVRKHSEHIYYSYMLGFAPGHVYMAREEEPFEFARRETARINIPAQSVVVQKNLSNLIPFDQPCGWNIIGATPLVICDYDREDPFLVHPGEWVKYVPISRKEYDYIKQADLKGNYKVKRYKKEIHIWDS